MLRDQLFPTGEANRHDGLLQTEWSEGWPDEFMGLGALTHWMTPRLRELHGEMDYAGAAVVFLQRHRLELGLKALADHAGATVKMVHDLNVLWDGAEAALKPSYPDEWNAFADDHREFVKLVAEIDPDSYHYRYGVDKANAPNPRPRFIDLSVFEHCGAAFEGGVEDLLHLPI